MKDGSATDIVEPATGGAAIGVIAANPETVEVGARSFNFDSPIAIWAMSVSINNMIDVVAAIVGIIIGLDLIRKWRK